MAARTAALAELDAAKASDPLAAYAAGSVQFFVALEKLGGGLHRHGFESPQSFMLPLMRLPVPANPNPEPLTYEGFRQILADFREAMAQSAATLAMVPAGADIGVEVDLAKLGIDLNEDGNIAPRRKRGRDHGRAVGAAAPRRRTPPRRRWSSASTAPTATGCRAMPTS